MAPEPEPPSAEALERYRRHLAEQLDGKVPPPVGNDPLGELRYVAAMLACAKQERNRYMRQLRNQGFSLREIAQAAGMSHQMVANLTKGTDQLPDQPKVWNGTTEQTD